MGRSSTACGISGKERLLKNGKLPGIVLRVLLGVVYFLLACFGFLSGMFSEGLIGHPHPMAAVIVWVGVAVGLSPMVCVGVSFILQAKTRTSRVVLTIPFILLAVQLVLCHAAAIL